MADKAKPGRGRPTVYTEAIAVEICDRLAKGESLRRICEDDHLPIEGAVRMWVVMDREGFYTRYMQAREAQALKWSEEITEIIDESSNDILTNPDGTTMQNNVGVARARLRMDGRLHLMRMVVPRIFGDKGAKIEGSGVTVNIRRFTGDE